MLREFWSKSAVRGIHPEDKPLLQLQSYLAWSPEEAARHEDTFASEKYLHRSIHTNLFPQPFIGNLDSSYVYVLYGNPGFTPADYRDEFLNSVHATACSTNLRDGKQGFFPLLPPSTGTGVANYWRLRLRSLTFDLALQLKTTIAQATEIVCHRVSLIEAGAYHSKSRPGVWIDSLPSSSIAKRYAQEVLLAKARRKEVLIFVWRQAHFWGLPDVSTGVLLRSPSKAQLSYISKTERQAIVAFLAKRVREV